MRVRHVDSAGTRLRFVRNVGHVLDPRQQAVVHLATAPKSNTVTTALGAALVSLGFMYFNNTLWLGTVLLLDALVALIVVMAAELWGLITTNVTYTS